MICVNITCNEVITCYAVYCAYSLNMLLTKMPITVNDKSYTRKLLWIFNELLDFAVKDGYSYRSKLVKVF